MKLIILVLMFFFSTPYLLAEDGIDEELSDAEWESVGGYPSVKGQTIEENLSIKEITQPKVDYHFSPFSKTSPFAAPMVLGLESERSGGQKTPLTSNSLGSYKFVGIWRANGGKPRTLIMTPKGVGVVAKEGTAIGKKDGKVFKIFETKIIIREYEKQADGTLEYEDVTFNISGDSSDQKKDMGSSDDKLKTSNILSH